MIRRIMILAAGLLVAGLSAYDATLAHWRLAAAQAGAPAAAHVASQPGYTRDPAIRVMAAQAALGRGLIKPEQLAGIAADARAALLQDPLNPAALHQLGLVAEQRRPGSGTGLFVLARQISRREPGNELVLERLAAASGDTAGAIADIDRIVSVAPPVGDVLFVPLVPALADPAIRRAFIARADRPWYPGLLRVAIDHGGDQMAVLAMLRAAVPFQPPGAIDNLHYLLLSQIITAGRFDEARAAVAAMPAGARAAIATMGFSAATSDPRLAPLTWALTNQGPASAHITGGNSLTVTISPEHNTIVADRWTLLDPGTYEVVQDLVFDPRAPHAGVIWDVLCAGAQPRPIANQPMRTTHAQRQTDRWALTIPAGCGAQLWHMKAYGDAGAEPAVVTVASLGLVRR